ncbi:hypothetical protein OROHE_003683 [Orobanche hederae]
MARTRETEYDTQVHNGRCPYSSTPLTYIHSSLFSLPMQH